MKKMTNPPSSTNLLEVNNIEVVYNDIVQVLRGVSLAVSEGGIVALLGTNGAGSRVLWTRWEPAGHQWSAPQELLSNVTCRLSQSLAGATNRARLSTWPSV